MSWDSQEISIRYKPAPGLMIGLVPRYAVGLPFSSEPQIGIVLHVPQSPVIGYWMS